MITVNNHVEITFKYASDDATSIATLGIMHTGDSKYIDRHLYG